MLITRDRTKKTLTIHMPQYVKRILEQFRLQDAHPRTLPLDPGVRYSNDMSPTSPEDVEYMKSVPYTSAIGSLMYLVVTCRPDIAYAVSVLSRYMKNPGKMHWVGVKGVLRYLKGTSDKGITFGGSDIAEKHVLSLYSDSDWAGCVDSSKSTSGYIAMFNNGPIQWKWKHKL